MECYFVLGKGGVGKSTISVLKALAWAKKGKNVSLISLDQAHNLSDIIGSDRKLLPKDLNIFEPDIEQFIKQYLNSSEQLLQKNYRYLTALNLEHHFKILKQAPGLEEYGLLLAFQHFWKNRTNPSEVLIFDMPPTAIALKFFSLPFVSLVWLEQLLKLRNEILQKKEIISKVKFGKVEVETDAIKKNLEQQLASYRKIVQLLRDCQIVLVANPDSVSLAESKRIKERLSDLNIEISEFYLNKSEKQTPNSVRDYERFAARVKLIPKAAIDLVGTQQLIKFLEDHETDLI